MFRKYEKVERIEKPECEGILNGTVYVFEKLDGSNASCWKDENNKICTGSRSRQLSCGDNIKDEFRGFVQYILNNNPINELLNVYPNLRIYGEWLVKHSLNYPVPAYKKFYVFDVYDNNADRYLSYEEYSFILQHYNLLFLKPLSIFINPSIEDINSLNGKTQFNISSGEGIVVKNYGFKNRWGNCIYGKIVTEDFREINKLSFPASKKEDIETRIISQYITRARVQKNYFKMLERGLTKDEKPSMRDIPVIMSLVFNDMITEDIWDILKKFKNPVIDFKALQKKCSVATKSYYVEIIQEEVS